jgi:CheY-like chemotaxis protein
MPKDKFADPPSPFNDPPKIRQPSNNAHGNPVPHPPQPPSPRRFGHYLPLLGSLLTVSGGALYAQAPPPGRPTDAAVSGPSQTSIGLGVAFLGLLTTLIPKVFEHLDRRRQDSRAKWEQELADRRTKEQLDQTKAELERVKKASAAELDQLRDKINSNTTFIAGVDGKADAALGTLREEGRVGPGSSDEIPLRPSILLVEDNQRTAKAMAKLLARHGFQVEIAPTLEKGLKGIEDGHDWVMLDLDLGGQDGREILIEARRQEIPVRFVVTTGTCDDASADDVKAMLTPEDIFICKPVKDLDELFARIAPRPSPPSSPMPGAGG